MDDVLSWKFADWFCSWAADDEVESQMTVAFVGDAMDEQMDGQMDDESLLDIIDGPEDVAVGSASPPPVPRPIEELISEETLLDEVEVPGLPEDEAERRKKWKALPQRVRIAVRRLHRQFGHVPRQTMIHLLRAAKIRKEFVDAVRWHRCTTCEETSFSFNHTLGIDVLEVTDCKGDKFQVLNMVDMGTTFQLCEVVKVGAGQPSSTACLQALQKRWFSWCGHPVNLVCDRGLHNRGVLAQYMNEHGIQVYHSPLEAPENIGRVERHGGLIKGLFRKVCKETSALGKEQVESVLLEVCITKNNMSRLGGFSPSQWVLGKEPRSHASAFSEERFAEFGALEARHNPESIFALQHLARMEAQKAFVHLDCSRRVQRAMTKNASGFPRDYSVGDLVIFRRDNQRGGTSWSPTSRVIGHEGPRNLWLLCGNVPVLVANQNVRSATASEALAHAVLHGNPVSAEDVVSQGQQQSFLDARRNEEVSAEAARPEAIPIEDAELEEQIDFPHINWGDGADLPPVPEEEGDLDEFDWTLRPGLFEEDGESDGPPALEELAEPARSSDDRRRTNTNEEPPRNVRPRLEAREPEAERGSSLAPSTRDSGQTAPAPLPNVHDYLDDLPVSLREHLARARERDAARSEEEKEEARALFVCFLSKEGNDEDEEVPGKKVLKSIHFESAPPEVQKAIMNSRVNEWSKYDDFGAVFPLTPELADELIRAGHQCIPSKWVDVDKNEFKKGKPDYEPNYKSRLVSCGNFEFAEGLRSDSPTADVEAHHLICCWCATHGTHASSADVTSAYFQGMPLDRLLLMRQPRGGLPGVPEDVIFAVRVPVYGLTDSGRGFWLRLDQDARTSGLKGSKFFPGLYYLPGKDGDAVAVMATHVDDLLYSYLEEGKPVIENFLKKFNIGTTDTDKFRYCGKQFEREEDGTITLDTFDNTRKVKQVKFDERRPKSERLEKDDITRLRSVTGSLAWVSRQTRPDLGYRVSRLQSSVKDATVGTLAEANATVTLAHKGNDVKLRFPQKHLDWKNIGIITVTDASFSNEKDYKSQQGRMHFLGDLQEVKDPSRNAFRVMPLGFASCTIKRVCRSTLQAETYALQTGIESGDKLRGAIAEVKGYIKSMKTWLEDSRAHVPHLMLSDCRSLTDHLASEIPAKVADKRLGIELQSIHEGIWEDGRETWQKYAEGGDKLVWIATHTMISDCLTKSMRPDLLLRVLKDCMYRVQRQ